MPYIIYYILPIGSTRVLDMDPSHRRNLLCYMFGLSTIGQVDYKYDTDRIITSEFDHKFEEAFPLPIS